MAKARLKPNQVAEIRHRFRAGWKPKELAEEYQRSVGHIYRVLSYRCWPVNIPYQHPLPFP